MSRLLFVTVCLVGLLLTGVVLAEPTDCTPVPSCNGQPQCSQPDDCNSKTWPLACDEAAGWWECCNGLQRNESCCVPHCPEQEAETTTGGDEDAPTRGDDGGGCAAAGAGASLLGTALLGLALLLRRRAR